MVLFRCGTAVGVPTISPGGMYHVQEHSFLLHLLLVAGAILFWSAGPSLAHGGGHGGGGHGGGGHAVGGFRSGPVVGHIGGNVVGRVGVSNAFVRPYYRNGYSGYYYPYSGYYPYSSSYYYPYSSSYLYAPSYSVGGVSPYYGGGLPLTGTATLPMPGPQTDAIARIHMKVPADAEVWFQGEKMSATGSLREFQSPPLPPGSKYAYEIRARWRQDGREVMQMQTIPVFAGADVTVQFPIPQQPPEQTPPETLR